MSLQSQRERINLVLYGSKNRTLNILKWISLIVSIASIGVLMVYYGYPQTEESRDWLLLVIEGSFVFYVLGYIVRIIYDFAPMQFLRRTWFEGLLLFMLVIEGISWNFFDVLLVQQLFVELGFQSFEAFSFLFIQLYILVVVAVEITKSGSIITNFRLHPANIFILSFAILIAIGTLLLCLPEMSTAEGSMNFIDALFTSTSATCVTGLVAVDTSTEFTFKGHFVIMMLMKLGGLNIVSFATIMVLLSKLGVGMKQHSIVEDFVTKESFFSARGMFLRVLGISLGFELLGAIMIYFLTLNEIPDYSGGERVFFSVFHSISAFNNAGFSTLGSGLYTEGIRSAFLLHVVFGFLIVAGAIGFTTMVDLFSPSKLRDRLIHPWKKPMMSSRIALNMYLILIVFGGVLFFFLEANNTHSEHNFTESIISSVFQSVSARSAGFNTVDMHELAVPTLIIIIFLMFVGGSSYSTAGGIKTSTFTILLLSAYSTIRGKKKLEIYKRTIPNDDLQKAFSIFLFSLGGILVGTFLLSVTESHILAQSDRNIMDLAFEQVSAFSTCGLSTGITGDLSDAGKVIVILSMFIGRLGTLTIAFALSKGILSTNYRYPEEHILVG